MNYRPLIALSGLALLVISFSPPPAPDQTTNKPPAIDCSGILKVLDSELVSEQYQNVAILLNSLRILSKHQALNQECKTRANAIELNHLNRIGQWIIGRSDFKPRRYLQDDMTGFDNLEGMSRAQLIELRTSIDQRLNQ